MKRFVLVASLLMVAAGIVVDGRQVRPTLFGIQLTADAFFDDAFLHEIRLNMNAQDWQSLKDHYLQDTFYPCDFRWRNQVVRNIGIRSRGTGSRNGTKPGLLVDFNQYVTGQTFLGLESVVLRNNTQDASNLNERLSMLLFRRMGIAAPREAHAKLYVNDQHVGLYMIVESVDNAFLKRTLGENAGYLYEYDYPANGRPYYFEYRGSDPNLYVPLPFRPENHRNDPRPEFIEQLVQTINQTSDAAFRGAIGEYLDLTKFIRYVAVEMFVGDNDGFLGDYAMNNFFLYRFDNSKLFTFIPWDKSEAFKNGFEYSIFHNISDVPSFLQNRLMARVLRYPDLYDLYLDTLVAYARSAEDPGGSTDGRGWLEREMQSEYRQIRDAALTDPLKPFTNEQFEGAISALGVFARRRGDFVRSEVGRARTPR